MNEVFKNLYLDNIKKKQVYYFSNEDFDTDEPHYYVCINRTKEEVILLVSSTTQFKKKERFVETRRIPYSTLVYVNPSQGDPMAKKCLINCNTCHEHSVEYFKNKIQEKQLTYKGEISDHIFEQILIGLHDSPEIENYIKKLIGDKPT